MCLHLIKAVKWRMYNTSRLQQKRHLIKIDKIIINTKCNDVCQEKGKKTHVRDLDFFYLLIENKGIVRKTSKRQD
jgi:hypothetical protein